MGDLLYVEPVVVPALMLICDGLLLAWLLVELRDAGLGDAPGGNLEPLDAVDLLPTACWACLAVPARYLATVVWLTTYSLPNATPDWYLPGNSAAG